MRSRRDESASAGRRETEAEEDGGGRSEVKVRRERWRRRMPGKTGMDTYPEGLRLRLVISVIA